MQQQDPKSRTIFFAKIMKSL